MHGLDLGPLEPCLPASTPNPRATKIELAPAPYASTIYERLRKRTAEDTLPIRRQPPAHRTPAPPQQQLVDAQLASRDSREGPRPLHPAHAPERTRTRLGIDAAGRGEGGSRGRGRGCRRGSPRAELTRWHARSRQSPARLGPISRPRTRAEIAEGHPGASANDLTDDRELSMN